MTSFDVGLLQKLAEFKLPKIPKIDSTVSSGFKDDASKQLNASSGMNKAIATAKSLPDLSKTKIDTKSMSLPKLKLPKITL